MTISGDPALFKDQFSRSSVKRDIACAHAESLAARTQMQTFADPSEFLSYAKGTGRQYASLTLRQGVTLLGSIVLELFDDLCPDTCANFISLIEGPGSYKYKVRNTKRLSACSAKLPAYGASSTSTL